jgi:hypothetical protein
MNRLHSNESYWDSLPALPQALRTLLPDDSFAFPGLINAHDHLEFNLFPPLANRVYSDYLEWGEDIHVQQKEVIQKIEQIPLDKRIRFGVLKNLVNGFTRVVHHGTHHPRVRSLTHYPVWMNYYYVHALGTEPRWKLKLNLPFTGEMMVHVGEGTSLRAELELERLIKWNWVRKRVTGIHAIGLTQEQASHFKAVIWCPASNLFLYNKTMAADRIKGHTTVLFGTDSTVSSQASLWDQLRMVRSLEMISDHDLLTMLTFDALAHFYGQSPSADWVVARRKKATHWDSFFNLHPEDILLVTIKGSPWLCDDSLPASLRPPDAIGISVGGVLKWVERELGEVVSALRQHDVPLPLHIQSR